jgi:hypothetical protein
VDWLIVITDEFVVEEMTNTSVADVCKTIELGVTPEFSNEI